MSSLHFIPLGLLPLALPILLVGNMCTLVNVWWFLDLWTLCTFDYHLALVNGVVGVYIHGIYPWYVFSGCGLMDFTIICHRWTLVVFIFSVNAADWLFDMCHYFVFLFGWFGLVANSTYIIGLWCHCHCCNVIIIVGISIIIIIITSDSNSSYIIDGSNFICGIYTGMLLP